MMADESLTFDIHLQFDSYAYHKWRNALSMGGSA